VIDSVLRGPLIIGPGTRIERSYVGPFSSIGPNCLVRDSEVAHTIVLEEARFWTCRTASRIR
jgi:glucose-1-phosphate thymidylyltransferase